eukprot:4688116-Prymnesium_polylepis.1
MGSRVALRASRCSEGDCWAFRKAAAPSSCAACMVHDRCFVLTSLSRMRAWVPGRVMATFRVSIGIACWWVTDAVAR